MKLMLSDLHGRESFNVHTPANDPARTENGPVPETTRGALNNSPQPRPRGLFGNDHNAETRTVDQAKQYGHNFCDEDQGTPSRTAASSNMRAPATAPAVNSEKAAARRLSLPMPELFANPRSPPAARQGRHQPNGPQISPPGDGSFVERMIPKDF